MTRTSTAPLFLSTLVALAAMAGCSIRANAKEQHEDAFGGKRESVSLVVYAEDFAQINETRPFELNGGANKIRIADVSKLLDPSSVLFAWSQPNLQVVSNTYDLGAGNTDNLMQRYVGSQVEMVWYGDNGKPGERAEGRLEMAGDGGTVIRTGDKLLVNPTGTLVAPNKSDVVTIPQLSLGVEAPTKASADLDVTYLTRGLSWSADYVATLDPNSDDIRLECWASVTNKTGVAFPDAKITLVAGRPNRAVTTSDFSGRGFQYYSNQKAKRDMGVAAEMPSIQMNGALAPVSYGELYAYPIKAKSTVAQDQINRVRMMYGEKVRVTKDYSVRLSEGEAYNYNYNGYYGRPKRLNAQLAIAFYNNKEDGLGLPLPHGAVRLYEPGDAKQNNYIGAAEIYDTPEKGRVNLTVTNVFDVTAEPKLTKTQRIDKKHVRRTYEVKLSNQKKAPVELRVVQGFYSTWKIESESVKSGRLDAHTNQWKVPIPAGGDVVLSYTVISG